jgi:hypothetical protein
MPRGRIGAGTPRAPATVRVSRRAARAGARVSAECLLLRARAPAAATPLRPTGSLPARGGGGRRGAQAPAVVGTGLPGGTTPRPSRAAQPAAEGLLWRQMTSGRWPAGPPAARWRPRVAASAGRRRWQPVAAGAARRRPLRDRSESAAATRGRASWRARPAPPPAAPAQPWCPRDPAAPRVRRRRPVWRARVSSGRARASPPAGTPAMSRARMSVLTRAVGRPGAIAKMVLAPMESARRLTLAIVSASRDRSPRGRHRKGGDRVRGRLCKAGTEARAAGASGGVAAQHDVS